MPYKDPERKLEAMRAWRKQVMPRGYGKWLYQRRKLRFEDAERFREALEEIKRAYPNADAVAHMIASAALDESQAAEEALGPWQAEDPPEEEDE